jgi:hypothetical protein
MLSVFLITASKKGRILMKIYTEMPPRECVPNSKSSAGCAPRVSQKKTIKKHSPKNN